MPRIMQGSSKSSAIGFPSQAAQGQNHYDQQSR